MELIEIQKGDELFGFFINKRNEAFLERKSEKIRFVELTKEKIGEKERIYLLFDEKKYVAGVSVLPLKNSAKIKNLWVDIDNRGKGYGSVLMDMICKEYQNLGFSILKLNVVSEYAPAINLYIKKGFTKSRVFPIVPKAYHMITMQKYLKNKGVAAFKFKTRCKYLGSKFRYWLMFKKDGSPKLLRKIIFGKKDSRGE